MTVQKTKSPMVKINTLLIVTALMLILNGCAQLERRGSVDRPVPTEPADEEVFEVPEELEELAPPRLAPKVGVVLGPGLMNAYAHVGVLKAFEESKIPIHAIAGLEWGSLPAALFAMKGLAHDVEWKMLRLERSELPDKGFFSSRIKARDIQSLQSFFNRTVKGEKVHQSQIAFGCPSFVIDRGRTYWQRQGDSSQVLARCMSFPPYFENGQGFYAAPFLIEEAAEHLRSRGAEVILYVDVLSGSPLFRREDRTHYLPEYLLWAQVAADSTRTQIPGVDHVIAVRTDLDIFSFDSRRRLIDRGLGSARPVLKNLANQYSF